MKISKRTGKPIRKYEVKGTELRRSSSQLTQNALNNLPEGENTKYINHLLAVTEIAKHADLNDVNTLKECFVEYIRLCAKTDMKMGNMNAYAAMGVARQEIFDWEHGRRRASQPEYRALALFVKSVLAAYRESVMQEGAINPIIGVWWQKAFDGMNEMTEVDASNMNDSAANKMDAKQIADKYQDLLPE